MFRVLLIFSVIAVAVAPSSAQDVVFYSNQAMGAAMAVPFPAPDEAIAEVQKALSLSDAQVTGLKALLNLRMQTSKTALQELPEKQKALQGVLAQTNPSALDVGNAYLAVQSVHNTLKSIEEKFQTDFRALLTADQRATLDKFQTAAGQIQALRLIGVLQGEQRTFELPLPGPLPMGGPIGGERSIRIFKAPVPR
jgi:hypothetical protein